jgi:succinate dehydrogenase/fumarate reductase flavoprotein subunit
MQTSTAVIQGVSFPIHSVNTLIIGSGAAALKTALALTERGQPDACIATERWGGGASNNSGSDKQTYYKLSLAGPVPDSPLALAEDLFRGGCMHGDIALCEAQHSAQAFYELVQLGVPFPHDRYGGFIGYRTDHDTRGRATSAGPLTSHYMFEALARRVAEKRVPVLDRHQAVALLLDPGEEKKTILGAVAFDLDHLEDPNHGLVLFNAVNVVLATGGPGGLYESSAYPEDQTGSIGLALQIGAVAHNLTESQFGLASLRPRWNVSGSYQQVIPRYVSTGTDGQNERDFLNDHFPDMPTLAGAIFKKGYQWPFDAAKIAGFGSSLIDLAVYEERVHRGRRVFLDFTRNPRGDGGKAELDLAEIPPEAREYLENSQALQGTPIERLVQLNPRAVEFYRERGVNLARDWLEIAGCAQHNNGGLRANDWWECSVRRLFAVGEVNGTHGVVRPGGAALNAGQVGAMRAAMVIKGKYHSQPSAPADFFSRSRGQLQWILDRIAGWRRNCEAKPAQDAQFYLQRLRRRMSSQGAQIRNPLEIDAAISAAWKDALAIDGALQASSGSDLPQIFKTRELALTHAVYLEAIGEYLRQGGASRGSYLVLSSRGDHSCGTIGRDWRFSLSTGVEREAREVLEISLDQELAIQKRWVPVRPIPNTDRWFENVWKDYLAGKLFDDNEAQL